MEKEDSIVPLPIELPTRPDDESELNVTEKLQLSDSDAEEEQDVGNRPAAKLLPPTVAVDMAERTGDTHRFTSSDNDSNDAVLAAEARTTFLNSMKKRINQLVDSDDDSDNEPESIAGGQSAPPRNQIDSDDDDGQEVGKLMVSESDEESPTAAKKVLKRIANIVDSDSSSSAASPYQPSDSDGGQPKKRVEVKKVKKLRKKSQSTKASSSPPEGSELRTKLSAICDQSSEDEDYRMPEGEVVKPSSKSAATERPPQRVGSINCVSVL